MLPEPAVPPVPPAPPIYSFPVPPARLVAAAPPPPPPPPIPVPMIDMPSSPGAPSGSMAWDQAGDDKAKAETRAEVRRSRRRNECSCDPRGFVQEPAERHDGPRFLTAPRRCMPTSPDASEAARRGMRRSRDDRWNRHPRTARRHILGCPGPRVSPARLWQRGPLRHNSDCEITVRNTKGRSGYFKGSAPVAFKAHHRSRTRAGVPAPSGPGSAGVIDAGTVGSRGTGRRGPPCNAAASLTPYGRGRTPGFPMGIRRTSSSRTLKNCPGCRIRTTMRPP